MFSVPVFGLEVVELLVRSLELLEVVIGGAGGTSSVGDCTTTSGGAAGTYVVISLVVLVVPQAPTKATSARPVMLIAKR